MAATAYTSTVLRTTVVGNEYEVEARIDCTVYETTAKLVLAPSDFKLRRLTQIVSVSAEEKALQIKWDGASLTAPKFTAAAQEPTNAGAGVLVFTEMADQSDLGTFRVIVRGRR